MLEDRPAEETHAVLLDAIEDAARRGGQLTTVLLAHSGDVAGMETIDISNHLLVLAPMIRALAGRHVDVKFELSSRPTPARLSPGLFEAVILELVANARSALHKPGRIIIRTRRMGAQVVVIIADNGVGCEPGEPSDSILSSVSTGANGTGLGRVRRFAKLSHGVFRLRSRPGRGSCALIRLPAVLKMAVDRCCCLPAAQPASKEEYQHEKRQPITARRHG
ncbi:ATP-binding protein [Sphingomonas sp. YR710]|uniref:ATP-binding protein n=1 Tax=Sphingomonas sp. YR710 TaxID=1882773 RepID=UPI0015A26588|nr:HAMP domain-containing sensor histidine kinase [Sphingomonas sp. YR710]